jgi:FKBP-type peptidyl-prolyl cis-trans isomerase FklB
MLLSGDGLSQTPAASAPAATTQPAQSGTTPKTSTTKAPVKKTGTAAKTTTSGPLTTKTEKFSYALGMDIGSKVGPSLKKQSVDVDPALVSQGLKDAMSGGKTRLTEQEAQTVLTDMQAEVTKQRQEKQEKAAAANKAEGDAFLSANKSKEGVVTLPSGLQYKILKEGTGPKPVSGDTVSCNYRGTLINGTEFDSSAKHGEAAKFGVSQVIKGWTEALQLMPVGSKWQLFVPPSLAYAERGAGADIGPDTTLIFEVELLSIEKGKDEKPDADKKDDKSEEKK